MSTRQDSLRKAPTNPRRSLHSSQPGAGMGDVGAKEISIVREDPASLASARDADVELFLAGGGQGAGRGDHQHLIHGLALGGVGRDGVAVGECAVVPRNHPAIGQQDGIPLHGLDLHQFAVHELLALGIGLQQQLVTGSHLQCPLLPHVAGEACIQRGGALTQWEETLRAICTLNLERIALDGDDGDGLILGKALRGR